ncbi:MAG TPA: protease pro-enzyme activation domain-containing protein [Terriglobales bacterium]|nr:protease pro-enzyme activation domain-containing protein [Terriglobales bacterium]
MTRLLVVAAFVGLTTLAFPQNQPEISIPLPQPRILQPVDESQRTVLKGNTHPLARPQFDLGSAPADLPMQRMLLVLKRSPEQEAALRQLLDEQQDKSSPNYHKWLTPDEFGKRFGPADQDIQVVTNWLQSHGFQVAKVAHGRNFIEFSGTAAQVQEAFATSIHKYAVKGKEHWANASDPQIPAALTPVVAGVHTLHNFLKKPMSRISDQQIPAKYVKGEPLTTFTNGVHALSPADYATIYNINPAYSSGINGSNTTIAVVGRSNLFNGGSDVQAFRLFFGGGSFTVTLNGPDPGDLGDGEEAEATLDVTWAGAVATGALVNFVVSASTNTTDGVDLSEAYIIDNNLGDVMTESFGLCEAAFSQAEFSSISALAEQAAAQGITYMVSTGDSGAQGCDDANSERVATFPSPSINALASTPFTVAVGGTMFNENGQNSKYWSSTNNQANGSALSYIPEDVWNESCTAAQCGKNANIFATGGGPSSFNLINTKPSWQAGVPGVPNDGVRDIPDVSLTAAGHDGYILCLEGSCVPDTKGFITLFLISGTSASAPSFAGIMALVDQKMGSNPFTAGRQGQADYVLYRLAASNPATCNASSTTTLPSANCIFHDVTVGNNAVPGELNFGTPGAKFQSTKGYDLATGLGSVNVSNLVNAWAAAHFNATTTTLVISPSPTVITHGQAVSANVTVNGSSVPTGDVSLLTDLSDNVNGTRTVNICSGFHSCTLSPLSSTSAGVTASQVFLPGGSDGFSGANTYNVHAHYAGDSNSAPSDSAPVAVTVNPEVSSTSFAIFTHDSLGNLVPFGGGPYGSLALLTATITGTSGIGVPTGTVNFQDSGTVPLFTSAQLNRQAQATNAVFTFASGSHSLAAQYGGDPSFQPSTSSTRTFSITPDGTATGPSFAGATTGATLNAAITTPNFLSGGNPPSGIVTFTVDGTQVGTAPVTGVSALINSTTATVTKGASATASLLDSNLANGQHTLIVAYSGDSNYTASTAQLAFNLQPDFSFGVSGAGCPGGGAPCAMTIPSPGLSGSLSIAIAALDGFTGTVSFTCSGLPAESTCTFNPTSVKNSGQTVLTVSTTAARFAALPRGTTPSPLGPQWWFSNAGLAVAGIFIVGAPGNRRRRSKWLSLMPLALALLAVGCGGGGSSATPAVQHDAGTPPGTYNLVVTAASGSISHQVGVTLRVQ